MKPLLSLGEFEQITLLAILRLEENAYGVTIREEIASCTGREPSPGALYTTLDRLESKGLVRWKIAPGTRERNGLPRRCYTVSARGVAALRSSQQVLQRMWHGLDDILKEPQ